MILGAHVPGAAPLKEAESLDAACLQMFVGPPQEFKQPPPRDDIDELAASNVPIYVHAPYRINVAHPNPRIRIPSRKTLQGALERAAEIGAAGFIVHGGHAEDGVEAGYVRWAKVFEELGETPVPILIENTAGGDNAMARYVENIAKLWTYLTDYSVGFCFDTCHAHAAGEELDSVVERVLEATGRIDLVHANSSRDETGTGADRHANFDQGLMDPESIVSMIAASGAPAVICETPWPGIAADLDYLRANLDL
jgi:deoxyribonuclease IV